MNGPLTGVTVLELGGIGPGPFAGMMLADQGACVLRVAREDNWNNNPVLMRGRTALRLDLKNPDDVARVHRLVERCDIVIEGFRPGVAERLGVGPEDLLARNPALVYGRMTGWGQDGPMAMAPGHDINYLSLTGALAAIGPIGGDPVPPLNLVADFGGGGMLLVFGLVSAVLNARATGTGQVVDAAMVDGASLLLAMQHGWVHTGLWRDDTSTVPLAGAAPWYRTYRCADGRHLAVGCVEPQFYAAFREVLGLAGDTSLDEQWDHCRWPEQGKRIATLIATRARDEWAALFEGTQACTTPVLTLSEAPEHHQMRARATLPRVDGLTQPAPAPRYSVTTTTVPAAGTDDSEQARLTLVGLGFTHDDIDHFLARTSVPA